MPFQMSIIQTSKRLFNQNSQISGDAKALKEKAQMPLFLLLGEQPWRSPAGYKVNVAADI